MSGIVAGFHVRNDDWILPRKLYALTAFCDRVVVLMDRCSRSTLDICRSFLRVEPYMHINSLDLPDEGPDGPICEEGLMRQRVWDLLAASDPDWVVLGDADEIPTPDIVDFFKDPPDVDLCYMHWVNLYKDEHHYISGKDCVWSFQHPKSNKKGVIVRFDRARHEAGGYRYDIDKFRHTRLEPSPLHSAYAVLDERHVLLETPKLIHWKWVNWDRWEGSKQAQLRKYRRYWRGMELSLTPGEWKWR